MKVYTVTNHSIHWPVGGASVVVAENEQEATELLDTQLMNEGLVPSDGNPYTLEELDISKAQAIILCNGDY